MDRDKRAEELRAQWDGYAAGIQWLSNELHYYNELDLLVCEECGRKFYVPEGDYVSLGSGTDAQRFHRGGWAGSRNYTGGPDMCHPCVQAMRKRVEEMEAEEKAVEAQ